MRVRSGAQPFRDVTTPESHAVGGAAGDAGESA